MHIHDSPCSAVPKICYTIARRKTARGARYLDLGKSRYGFCLVCPVTDISIKKLAELKAVML